MGGAEMKGRSYDYEAFRRDNRDKLSKLWLEQGAYRATCSSPRPVRRRPRDPVEIEVLTHLAKVRLEQALATGELVILGPRRYRLRVFEH